MSFPILVKRFLLRLVEKPLKQLFWQGRRPSKFTFNIKSKYWLNGLTGFRQQNGQTLFERFMYKLGIVCFSCLHTDLIWSSFCALYEALSFASQIQGLNIVPRSRKARWLWPLLHPVGPSLHPPQGPEVRLPKIVSFRRGDGRARVTAKATDFLHTVLTE